MRGEAAHVDHTPYLDLHARYRVAHDREVLGQHRCGLRILGGGCFEVADPLLNRADLRAELLALSQPTSPGGHRSVEPASDSSRRR
jgi:hypothetical protein